MADLFDHAFLARQRSAYPHLDVHAIAAGVREANARKPVLNPNGLLIHRLAEAEKARRSAEGIRDAMSEAELQRYADMWIEIFRVTATRQLTPAQVLRCFRAVRAAGFTKMNRHIDARLAQLGDHWPAAPTTPPANGTAEFHDRRSHGAGLQAQGR